MTTYKIKKRFCAAFSAALLAAALIFGAPAAPRPAQAVPRAVSQTFDVADPVEIAEAGFGAGLTVTPLAEIAAAVAGKTVVFTGSFYYMDTPTRTEQVVEYAVSILGTGEHKITKKYANNGGNEIPVPGYLLSFPASKAGADGLNAGDEITLAGVQRLAIPKQSVDNLTKRVRAVFQYVNASVRKDPGIVYYGPEYGTNTGQNQFGSELNAELNEADGRFYIKDFRAPGTVLDGGADKVGLAIPALGFALSGYAAVSNGSETARAMLFEGNAFSKGDRVQLSGYDYLGLDMEEKTRYDYLDPTDAENPAGAGYTENRGTNQLNVYTKSPDTGKNELNTNTWGFEAAVNAEGVVTLVSVNVIYIPEGGFVVSGHGVKGDWVKNYIKVGSNVTYDNETKTLTVSTSQSSYLVTMQNKLAAMKKNAEDFNRRLYDIDLEALNEQLDVYGGLVQEASRLDEEIRAETDAGLKFMKQVRFKSLVNEAQPVESKILMLGVESRVVEGRAAWHRPNVLNLEKNLDEMVANLTTLSECGINSIFVETLWNGYSSYKSELVTYHPQLAQYTYGDYPDFLTAYITEAKKLGIEVHAWVENFFVGSSADLNTPFWEQEKNKDTILGKHPEWATYTRTGEVFQPYEISGSEHFVFMDASNPEVRQFLLDYYREIYETFPDIAGLNLDYIRFPTDYGGAGNPTVDSGYTRHAMEEFLDRYGYGIPVSEDDATFRASFVREVDKDAKMKRDWHSYRVELITDFVKSVRDMTDEVMPNAVISTATVPDYQEAVETKMQDWRTWVRNGWIDLCTPMSYYKSAESVQKNASQMITIINNIAYSYVGLGPYMGFAPVDYIEQINACYSAKSTGYNLFETSCVLLSKEVQAALKATAHKKKSIVASSSAQEVLAAVFADILDKADRIYLAKNAMTARQAEALSQKFDELAAMPAATAEQLVAVHAALGALAKDLERYAGGWAVTRIGEDLEFALTNLDIKISRAYLREGKWDPSKGETRPDKVVEEPDPGPSGSPSPPPSQQPAGGCGCGSLGAAGGGVIGGLLLVVAVFVAAMAVLLKRGKSKRIE